MSQGIGLFAFITVIAPLFQGKGRKVVLWIVRASLCLAVIYAGIYILDYFATKRAASQAEERSRQEKLSSKVEVKRFSPVIAIYNGGNFESHARAEPPTGHLSNRVSGASSKG